MRVYVWIDKNSTNSIKVSPKKPKRIPCRYEGCKIPEHTSYHHDDAVTVCVGRTLFLGVTEVPKRYELTAIEYK